MSMMEDLESNNSDSSSISSTSSSDETQPPNKRYKLPLSSNYKRTDISRQTSLRWKKKSEIYFESHCIPKNDSSSAVVADAPIDVNKSPEKISDKNETKVDNACTSNKTESDQEYAPRSSLVKASCSQSDVQKLDTACESADKVARGIGSIEDYYPSECLINNENGIPSSAPLKENLEGKEEDLCSLPDEVSDTSDSESAAESVDEEVPLSDKNNIFFNKIMFAESQLTVRDVIVLITAFSLDATLNDVAKVKLTELVKVLAGKKFSTMNLSKYMMNKCFSSQEENISFHYYCNNCEKHILYSVKADEEKKFKKGLCDNCKKAQQITNSSTNFFLSMDLKYEIQLLLSDPELKNDIINNLKTRDSNEDVYEDVYSGSIHKDIIRNLGNKSGEYILTVNANTDGAPLTKSGKTGFWPVQVILNDLSPKLRFKNILVCGLFLTSAEPKSHLLNLYLNQVYVKQMQQLFQEGIQIEIDKQIITFKFCTHAFIVDAVARAIVQNRIQFNGYYGCSWCYQLGKYFTSVHGVRYPVDQDGIDRTHESHINDVLMAEAGSICNGVKGFCVLQNEPCFDMVWSFPYEELHAMLLGPILTILNEWKNGDSEFKMTKAQMDFIEKRFLNITPTAEIHRLPRSGILKGTTKPKAVELKWWLIHYSLPCLSSVLNEDALDHFSLFVKCAYTLLTTTASDEDLDQCAIDLLTFVVNYAKYYGKDKITYNIHIMLHIIVSVRKTGPIFCNSAFPFESNIYNLKTYVSGPKSMGKQIARKYLQTLIFKTGNTKTFTKSKETISYCPNLFHPTRLSKSFCHGPDIIYCGKITIKNIPAIGNCATYKKCIYKSVVYHSEAYKQTKKTNNSIVQMHSGEYGQILTILDWNHEPYIELRFFHMFPENPFKNVTHIKKIQSEYLSVTLRPIADIKCKVMLINARNARYVSHLPNNIEVQ